MFLQVHPILYFAKRYCWIEGLTQALCHGKERSMQRQDFSSLATPEFLNLGQRVYANQK